MKNLLTAFFQCYDENVCFLDIKGIFPNVNGCRTPSVQGAKYCEILCAFLLHSILIVFETITQQVLIVRKKPDNYGLTYLNPELLYKQFRKSTSPLSYLIRCLLSEVLENQEIQDHICEVHMIAVEIS